MIDPVEPSPRIPVYGGDHITHIYDPWCCAPSMTALVPPHPSCSSSFEMASLHHAPSCVTLIWQRERLWYDDLSTEVVSEATIEWWRVEAP